MWRRLPPAARRSRAVSSVYGKIDQILLAYTARQAHVKNFQIQRRYGDLFKAMRDRVSFVIMGNFGQRAEKRIRDRIARDGLDPDLVHVHTALAEPDHAHPEEHCEYLHNEWIQDPFVVMETHQGETLLLEPYRSRVKQNSFLAEQFADTTGYALLPTRYLIEGGNILVGDDYALVGTNLLQRNIFHQDYTSITKAAIKAVSEDLKKALGMRYIFWMGEQTPLTIRLKHLTGPEGLQPFFHLDLFLTLGGKAPNGDELVLLARIDQNQVKGIKSEEHVHALHELEGAMQRIHAQLMEINESFPGPNFDVKRIPIGGRIEGSEATLRFVPQFYNNAQVEWYHGFGRIYLPSYPGSQDFEEGTLRPLLEDIGFKRITFIQHAFERYAERNGSLHCLTKVLKRSHY